MKSMKEFFKSITFKTALTTAGLLLAVLVIFQVGVFVGYRKAAFSYHWGENYYQTFEPPARRGGPRVGGMITGRERFPVSHGAVGKVLKIDLPNFIVEGHDTIEKVVRVSSSTSVVRFREKVSASDIVVGDTVTVLGSPNDTSEIEAKLIRIMPAENN